MEEKRSVWKETLNYGIILGLVSVVFSVLAYMLDLTFKTWIMWPSLVISILVLFLLLRSYRDHYNNGYITYGKSVGAGVVINVYAAIITALYIYVLYAFIDPGLVDQQMAMAEEKLIAKGIPESAIDAGMALQAKLMKPWITSLMMSIYGVFFGLIMSLLVSLFIVKKGNPLLDEEEPAKE
jgi:putative exporter of polyketide antibiotics